MTSEQTFNQAKTCWEASDKEGTEYRILSVHGISPGAKIKTLRDTRDQVPEQSEGYRRPKNPSVPLSGALRAPILFRHP